MEPTIGRQVHYIDAEGVTRPATITHVYDEGTGVVDLTYLTRVGTTVKPVSEADYDPSGNSPEAWSWPPRV